MNNKELFLARLRIKFFVLMSMLTLLLGMSTVSFARMEEISVSTGQELGIYYSVGNILKKALESSYSNYNVSLIKSEGALNNINSILYSDTDIGFVQANIAYNVQNHVGQWQDPSISPIRALFALATEDVNVVTTEDLGDIDDITKLKGNRVNVAGVGSGTNSVAIMLLNVYGIGLNDIIPVFAKEDEVPRYVKLNDLDAFISVMANPNLMMKTVSYSSKGIRILPIKSDIADGIILKYPYFEKTKIKHSDYPNLLNEGDIETIGLRTQLITRADFSEKLAYEITKAFYEHFDDIKAKSPVLEPLTKKDTISGVVVPFHKGSMRYFKESGLIKYVNPSAFPPEFQQ